MKPRSLVAVKFLHVFFIVSELCAALMAPIAAIGMWIFALPSGNHIPNSILLSPVGISLNAGLSHWKTSTGTLQPIEFDHLVGTVRVAHPQDYRDYQRATIPAAALGTVILGAAICALSDLLRRLFRNVIRGAVFVEANIRYMRWISILVMILGPCAHFVVRWKSAADYSYAQRHLTAEGISFLPIRNPDWSVIALGIIVGLVVLVFSEVFNQGLALKVDQELTV